MTQAHINRSVAQATGETVSEVARRGFVLLTPLPYEPDPEDLILDWDRIEMERNVPFVEQRQFRSVA